MKPERPRVGSGDAAGISGEGRAELTRLVGRGERLVTVEDAVEVFGVGRAEAAKRLAAWASRGWLRRVRRGMYLPVPVDAERPEVWTEDALYLADSVWDPCYFTGWTSANHWGLTEQVFRTTVVKTGLRVRRSAQELGGHEYLLVHARPRELGWGTQSEWRHERRLAIADPARTVVDILDDPRLGGGIRLSAEIVDSYLSEHEPILLVEYGDRLGNRSVFKRLGFIVETLGLPVADLLDACLERRSSGFVLLDPSAPAGGARVTRWGLRVNITVGDRDVS